MMSQSAVSDRWMVRTEKNQLAGPYSIEEVRKLIQDGRIGLQDEVCQGNHYWIYLHEREEVLQQLGVEIPRFPVSEDEEITETDTAYRPTASSGGPRQESRMAAQGAAPEAPYERPETIAPEGASVLEADSEIPELSHDQLKEALSEDTAVLTNRALREFHRKSAPGASTPSSVLSTASTSSTPSVTSIQDEATSTAGSSPTSVTTEKFYTANVTSAVEGRSFWQSFPWALVLAVGGLLGAALWGLLQGG